MQFNKSTYFITFLVILFVRLANTCAFSQSILPEEYLYDVNGNLILDSNKDISSIQYNFMNLADTITFSDGRKIIYTYTASGQKIRQKVLKPDGSQLVKRDYAGTMLYKNDTLQEVQHAEGRVVPLLPGTSLVNNAYQYHLKDHLGNVRLTFTSKRETLEYLATMESERSDLENTLFQNLKNTVSSVAANHTSTGNRAIFLPANTKKGPALSLAVRKGDIIIPETFAYYEKSGKDGVKKASEAFAQIIIGSLSGVPGTGEISGGANSSLPGIGILALPEPENEAPEAYLNFQLFDKNYKPIDAGFKRVTQAANFSQEKLSFSPIEMKETGYMYVYLSNTSKDGQVVYFDDFKVINTPIPIVQEDSYYPFGMPQEEMHDQREGEIANRNLYNGKELQDDLGLNWYDYGARMYDAALGRWHAVDSKADKYSGISPYVYAINNPIKFIDPDGNDIAIYYRENDKLKLYTFNGQEKDVPDNSFVRQVIEAYNYNVNNGGGDNLKSLAHDDSKIVYIEEGSPPVHNYAINTIRWSPDEAFVTGNGTVLSPATILEHEAAHAKGALDNLKEHKKIRKIADNNFRNKEEKRVIEGAEQKTARANKEIKEEQVTRTRNGEGDFIKTSGPTSTVRRVEIVGQKLDCGFEERYNKYYKF